MDEKLFRDREASRPVMNKNGNYDLPENVQEAARRVVASHATDNAEEQMFLVILGLGDPEDDFDYDQPIGAPVDDRN